MSASDSEPLGSLSGSEQQGDTSRSFRRQPVQTSINGHAVENIAGFAFGLREEQPFALPERLFEQLPFAVYVCDRDGLVLRYNRRAAELSGRSPKLGDPNERFCGSYRMFRPDGSLLPHHQCPMADVLRTGVPVRKQEVHIERPNGSRGIALVDIEAVRDSDGNIVGPRTAGSARAFWKKLLAVNSAVRCALIGAIKGSSVKLRCPYRDRNARSTDLPGPAGLKFATVTDIS